MTSMPFLPTNCFKLILDFLPTSKPAREHNKKISDLFNFYINNTGAPDYNSYHPSLHHQLLRRKWEEQGGGPKSTICLLSDPQELTLLWGEQRMAAYVAKHAFSRLLSPPKIKVTVKGLKQYCRENQMKGFSKHTKKQALQHFILKYEFD